MEEVLKPLSEALDELMFAVEVNTFLEDLTDEFDADIFFIHIGLVKPAVDDFGEFIGELGVIGEEGVGDGVNGEGLVVEAFDEVFCFVHGLLK